MKMKIEALASRLGVLAKQTKKKSEKGRRGEGGGAGEWSGCPKILKILKF
jgi:hypothetical protein